MIDIGNFFISLFCRYEDDPIVGHRLYREVRRVETKNTRAKGSSLTPLVSLQWETVATDFDEFQEASVSFSILVSTCCNIILSI